MDYVTNYGPNNSIIGDNVNYGNRLFDLALSLLVISLTSFIFLEVLIMVFVHKEIADIRGAIMSGIKDMLEQNNVYLI